MGVVVYYSYHVEPFGWGATICLALVVALANKYLGLRDPKIGFAAALCLGLLSGATAIGAQHSLVFILVATSIAAIVGYAFGSQRIDDIESEEQPKPSTKFKSGKGGDFGGGGSTGEF